MNGRKEGGSHPCSGTTRNLRRQTAKHAPVRRARNACYCFGAVDFRYGSDDGLSLLLSTPSVRSVSAAFKLVARRTVRRVGNKSTRKSDRLGTLLIGQSVSRVLLETKGPFRTVVMILFRKQAKRSQSEKEGTVITLALA